CNTQGLCAQYAGNKTVPSISLNNFSIGGPAGAEGLRENTYQAEDNYSWIVGQHSLTFGGIVMLSQINFQTFYAGNGTFSFNGSTETGLDFTDFLLGATTSFNQGVQFPVYNRARYYGLFGQDSWRATHNLTINYGLRWDVTTPWWEKYKETEALVPGAQSVVFPGAPSGWLVAGDPQIPRTVAPVRYGDFAPRIGVAYSLDPKGGLWRKLTGGAGKSSIRAGFGIFYSSLADYTNANGNGDAPYGLYWVNPAPAEFARPYVDLYTGNSEGQRFPVSTAVSNATRSHSDPNVNWAQYEPISSSPTYYYKNKIPYAESWMLSLQRQLARNTVLSVSYVGTAGRNNLVIFPANPATPSLCLKVSQPGEVAPGSNVCGPYAETGTFTTASGQVIQPRQQLSTNFGSTGWYRTIGTSNYNALESSLQYSRGRTSLLVAYTYSMSMDDSSSATEAVYPFDPMKLYALSAFDVTNDLVASYSYELPFDRIFPSPAWLTKGWILSGITTFSTGFPVTISENDDNSLIGATSLGPSALQDEPNYTPGKLLSQTNPRKGGTYFNTSLFSFEQLGQFGNANRRFFSGPGINNWDMALAKTIRFTESKSLELRFEFFNIFNHAQFNAPSGLINSSTFGVVDSARDPRIAQVSAKLHF
ncbi:MAG: TonB-dependent receptor domain-containing protein, partial [Terriglobia bacterium]